MFRLYFQLHSASLTFFGSVFVSQWSESSFSRYGSEESLTVAGFVLFFGSTALLLLASVVAQISFPSDNRFDFDSGYASDTADFVFRLDRSFIMHGIVHGRRSNRDSFGGWALLARNGIFDVRRINESLKKGSAFFTQIASRASILFIVYAGRRAGISVRTGKRLGCVFNRVVPCNI